MCSQNLDLRRNRRRAWANVYLAGRDSAGIGNRRAAHCGACGYYQGTGLPKCEKRLDLVGMDLRMTGRRFELPARYEMKTCVSIGLVLTRWVGAGISPRALDSGRILFQRAATAQKGGIMRKWGMALAAAGLL